MCHAATWSLEARLVSASVGAPQNGLRLGPSLQAFDFSFAHKPKSSSNKVSMHTDHHVESLRQARRKRRCRQARPKIAGEKRRLYPEEEVGNESLEMSSPNIYDKREE